MKKEKKNNNNSNNKNEEEEILFDQSLIGIISPPLSLARQFRRLKPQREQLPLNL